MSELDKPREYRKTDLRGPRYRKKTLHVITHTTAKRFLSLHPEYKGVSMYRVEAIIRYYNGLLWQEVVKSRDGVEFPASMGRSHIVAYLPHSKRLLLYNYDHKKSEKYNILATHKNFNSDSFIAKIVYSNYHVKYKVKNRELWSFKGTRPFTRAASQEFRRCWKKYVMVDTTLKIEYARKLKDLRYQIYKERKTQELPEAYDEFNMKES